MKKYKFNPILFNAIILILIVFLYYDVILDLFNDWIKKEQDSYGLVLAGLSVYFLFKKRKSLQEIENEIWLPGILIIILSILIFLSGHLMIEYYSQEISLVFLISGIISYLYGKYTLKVLSLPILFLFLSIPLPAIIINDITLPLKLVASSVAASMLEIFAVPVFREGNILQIPGAVLEVVSACSGIHSIFALLIIGILMSQEFNSYIQKFVFLMFIIPLSIFTNALRITITGLLYKIGYGNIALHFYHEASGLLIFIVALFLLLGLKKLICYIKIENIF
ncbi:MAG: exosortase/archaeosortase family protein [Desulfobacterales bacterium]|nr:exosortase/archaeosortase family protein [Desulfobacterales bacterium]